MTGKFGPIPTDWIIKPLSDVAVFLDGKRRPIKDTERAKMKGIYPYYGASGVVDYVNDYLFDEDLILLGEDGDNIVSRNTRLAFRVSGKIWVNNHAHVLKPISSVNIDFLSEYLESLDYSQYNSGSAQPKLNKQTCSSIPVVLPPKVEQDKIAKALADADSQIQGVEKLIAKKRDIKQATMQQLLTGKTRLPGFSGKWKAVQLDKLTEVIDPHPSHRAPSAVGSGVYFLGIGDLDVDGNIVGTNPRIVHESILKEHSGRYNLNDSLIGLGRVASIGKVIRLKDVGTPYAISPTLGVIKPQQVDPNFLFFALQSSEVSDQFLQVMSGSTRASVGMIVLRKLKIYLPEDRSEQTAIGEVLNSLDSELRELMKKLAKLNLIKQGMMQELLTGRIRLI